MAPPILVSGGTGTLGRLVVSRLRETGHDVRVLSRRGHVVGDLMTGEGVDAAVHGTEVIVHCAGSSKGDEVKARHLVEAATQVGVRHLVNISVVGADRIPQASRIDRTMFGYFGSKLAAERVGAESGVPWTTRRATQFHDLMWKVAMGLAKLPVIPVPAGFTPSSLSTPTRWRPGSSSWRWVRPPAWCPTSPDRRCTRWSTWCGRTSGHSASTGCSSPSGYRARRPAPSGRAHTWPPIRPLVKGRGRTFWPRAGYDGWYVFSIGALTRLPHSVHEPS